MGDWLHQNQYVTESTMSKRHIPQKKRIELLDAYTESGLSIKEYAAANDIGYSTLQRWLHDHKATLNTTDDAVHPLKGASLQQPTVNRQSYDRSDSTVHFMDITPRSAFSEVPPVKIVAERTNAHEGITSVFTSSASDRMTKESNISDKITPSALDNQLDVVLPNGIRMTFHQVSLDTSIALIKSLV